MEFIPIREAARKEKSIDEISNISFQKELNRELKKFKALYLNLADIFVKNKIKPIHALVILKTVSKAIVYYIGNIEATPADEIDLTLGMAETFKYIFDQIMSFAALKDLQVNDLFLIVNCMAEAFTIALLRYEEPETVPFSNSFYIDIERQREGVIDSLADEG